MAITDKFVEVGEPGSATYLASPGYTMGGTSLNLQTYVGWPTAGKKVIFDMYTIELVGTVEKAKANTRTYWQGIHNGTGTITSLERLGGADQNYPSGTSTRVVISHSAYQMNQLIQGLTSNLLDQDGTMKDGAVDNTSIIANAIISRAKLTTAFGNEIKQSWITGELPAINTPTYNGNRSYDIPFASSVAAILSPGMRLLLDKTVPGNAYMGGAFNGTSQYFTKVSPTGALASITDNFTLESMIQPTSYAAGSIAVRNDAAGNNGIYLKMESSGQISISVANAGVANYRQVSTYSSVPLNKKTHVAASWAGGTVVIYFDGVSMAVGAAVVGGTNPTTAGTGGDFAIGRWGASSLNYFTGYISNVAMFNAVLSAATIKQHATYKLLGSETNCIGAWSLDNTAVNQQAPGTNDLTAMGSVGYTAMSPHGQLGNGVEPSKAIALVMAVNGSTVTVQVPEGVTIPTTGGITNVSYATSGVPFGWVVGEERWKISTIGRSDVSQASPAQNTWYNLGSIKLNIPVGRFMLGGKFHMYANRGAAATQDVQTCISTSASSVSDDRFLSHAESGPVTSIGAPVYVQKPINLSAATDYYLNTRTTQAGSGSVYNFGGRNETELFALPAGI